MLRVFILLAGFSTIVYAGNNRPYGVSITGFQGSGTTGHDIGAGGYAGSSVVAPLASGGFNSPNKQYLPGNAFPSDPTGYGFGGYGVGDANSLGGDLSVPVAGGQGKLPSAAYGG